MPTFIPGLELAERFHSELIRPLINKHFPGLGYTAALIGYGSEVLGFDTPMSMDHAWAPRLQVFLAEDDLLFQAEIDRMLKRELPVRFLGFPLGTRWAENEPGVFFMDENTQLGDVAHKVSLGTLRDFVMTELDWDYHQPLEPADWLTIPSQKLLAITSGRVFQDDLGDLTTLRRQLSFYPHDVWLYLLACGWDRIGQEEPLMQRAGYVGDELGSAVMASRLVRDIMSLCFLMEKRYVPYPKWFGTAFKTLNCAPELSPLLWQVQSRTTWQERADSLGAACEFLARKHNQLGVTLPVSEIPGKFHARPFMVIHAESFSHAIFQSLTDPEVSRIAKNGPLGSLDQFSDNTILRSNPRWRQALKKLYS